MPELLQALSNRMKDMGSADKMKYLSNIFGGEAAVDGSLQNMTRLNRESSGQLQALSKSTGLSMDDLRAGMQDADKYAHSLGISFGNLSVYTAMLTQALSQVHDKMSNCLYDQYAEIVEGATGVSKKMADKVLKLFWGQKELLKSAISDVMITVGDVLLPSVTKVVTAIGEWTANLGKLASEHPEATKLIVGTVAAISALNVGIIALKYAWLGIKLPFQTVKVAFDLARTKMLLMGKTSLWAAAKAWQIVTKAWTTTQWLWNANLSANPIGLLIIAITGAIAAGYLLYKNWDKLKAWWNSWTIKDVFAVLKDYQHTET